MNLLPLTMAAMVVSSCASATAFTATQPTGQAVAPPLCLHRLLLAKPGRLPEPSKQPTECYL